MPFENLNILKYIYFMKDLKQLPLNFLLFKEPWKNASHKKAAQPFLT